MVKTKSTQIGAVCRCCQVYTVWGRKPQNKRVPKLECQCFATNILVPWDVEQNCCLHNLLTTNPSAHLQDMETGTAKSWTNHESPFIITLGVPHVKRVKIICPDQSGRPEIT